MLKLIKKFIPKSRYFLVILFAVISISVIAAEEPHDFPAKLPAMPESSALSSNTNTPQYVIIRPSDQVTFSSETAASVAEINVKEGSRFQTGDVLLTLDCRLQQAELNKSLAQYTAAKMAADSAKKLKSYGSISQFEFVKATAESDMANADVDKLRAIVEKCVIKAPFNGSVAEIMIHAHETVKPSDPLLKIVGTDDLEFEMQVPSCWLSWMQVGTTFKVHINETGQTISAKVTNIDPQIEPVSQSAKVIATITPDNPTLLPGMSGQAIFPFNSEKKCLQGTK